MNSKAGFTLLELLLVVVLISIITAFSVPVFSSLVTTNELNDATDKIVHSLRRAQLLSEHMTQDSSWGVFVEDGLITIFAGNDYASRDNLLDEIYDFSEEITVSGDNEYIFSKFTGLPDAAGGVTVTNAFGSETVTISSEGVITF